MVKTITATARPFLITFVASRDSFLLTSEEAQRLLDADTIVRATVRRVQLTGAGGSYYLQPATLGGGSAFIIVK